jgi:hypothetical protein
MKKYLYTAAAFGFMLTTVSCDGSAESRAKTPQEQASDDIDKEFEESMKELDEDVEQMEEETTVKTDELKKEAADKKEDVKKK